MTTGSAGIVDALSADRYLRNGQPLEEIYKIPAADWTPEQRAQVIAATTAKSYRGYARDDKGGWYKDNTAKTTAKQIANLNAAKIRNPLGKAFDPAFNRIKNTYRQGNSSDNTTNTTRSNIGKSIRDSISWSDVLSDPRGWVKLWAENNGHTGLASLANNPALFWGGIAAGAIGIPLTLSAIMRNNKGTGGVTNNYHYYGNQYHVPPTTSYWRV